MAGGDGATEGLHSDVTLISSYILKYKLAIWDILEREIKLQRIKQTEIKITRSRCSNFNTSCMKMQKVLKSNFTGTVQLCRWKFIMAAERGLYVYLYFISQTDDWKSWSEDCRLQLSV